MYNFFYAYELINKKICNELNSKILLNKIRKFYFTDDADIGIFYVFTKQRIVPFNVIETINQEICRAGYNSKYLFSVDQTFEITEKFVFSDSFFEYSSTQTTMSMTVGPSVPKSIFPQTPIPKPVPYNMTPRSPSPKPYFKHRPLLMPNPCPPNGRRPSAPRSYPPNTGSPLMPYPRPPNYCPPSPPCPRPPKPCPPPMPCPCPPKPVPLPTPCPCPTPAPVPCYCVPKSLPTPIPYSSTRKINQDTFTSITKYSLPKICPLTWVVKTFDNQWVRIFVFIITTYLVKKIIYKLL